MQISQIAYMKHAIVKLLTYWCLIFVVFINLSSANYLNNIVVFVMVQIYGF